jgi:creatinine amidohydrolase
VSASKGVWLSDLSWPEAKRRFDDGAVVLVPIGAAAKEHGHHLPLSTDYLVARELAERVMRELPIVVAPIVPFGYFPAFVDYPGSQHLRSETFLALLKDILSKLVRDGVGGIAVLNTGVSTEPIVRVAVRDLYQETRVRIATADIRALGRALAPQLEQRLGGHGDEAETSMILAIEPDAVRVKEAVEDYGNALEEEETVFYRPTIFSGDPASGIDFSRTGVRGDPTLASVSKGEALLAEMTRELVQGLRVSFGL